MSVTKRKRRDRSATSRRHDLSAKMVTYSPIPTPVYWSLWISAIVYGIVGASYYFHTFVPAMNPSWLKGTWPSYMIRTWQSMTSVGLLVLCYVCVDALLTGSITTVEIEIELLTVSLYAGLVLKWYCQDALHSRSGIYMIGGLFCSHNPCSRLAPAQLAPDAVDGHRPLHQARVLAHGGAVAFRVRPRPPARLAPLDLLRPLRRGARDSAAVRYAVHHGGAAGADEGGRPRDRGEDVEVRSAQAIRNGVIAEERERPGDAAMWSGRL